MSLTIEKCIDGWTNSLNQLHVKADIVFFGDSLTYWGDFVSLFPGEVVCNLGLRGDTITGMKSRIEQILVMHPGRVFIQGGINDVGECSFDYFFNEYEQLCRKVISAVPDADITVQTILPVNDVAFSSLKCTNSEIIRFNEGIESVAEKMNLRCLDLYSLYAENDMMPEHLTKDGIHLRDEAYDAWYKAIVQSV